MEHILKSWRWETEVEAGEKGGYIENTAFEEHGEAGEGQSQRYLKVDFEGGWLDYADTMSQHSMICNSQLLGNCCWVIHGIICSSSPLQLISFVRDSPTATRQRGYCFIVCVSLVGLANGLSSLLTLYHNACLNQVLCGSYRIMQFCLRLEV